MGDSQKYFSFSASLSGRRRSNSKSGRSVPLTPNPTDPQQSSPSSSPFRFGSVPVTPNPTDPKQPSALSSPFIFSFHSDTLDEETEERNTNDEPNENETPEEAKSTSTPQSALTGVIPCYFQGSSYSLNPSTPQACTSAGMEEAIRNEKHEVTEPEQLSSQVPERYLSQVVLVSRVLKGIPHSPHFLPLKGYSEVARHSLINAWDHIFEQVIDKIQSMQVNSFWVDAKRLWETMGELQNMGYNVITLRGRLVELTDVMLRLRKHKSEIRELKSKAEEHKMKKSKLEYEIVKLRARVEAEKAKHEEVMVKVAKMEQDMAHFDDLFSKIATMKI